MVEASHEYGCGHDEEKRDACKDSVSCDICLVVDHVPKSIAHA